MIEPLSSTGDLGLAIEVVDRSGACLVRIAGDLDAASGSRLDECVDRLVAEGAQDLTLDCAALRFCDSHGLRSLLVAVERVPGVVALVRPTANLRRVLQLTATESLFDVRE